MIFHAIGIKYLIGTKSIVLSDKFIIHSFSRQKNLQFFCIHMIDKIVNYLRYALNTTVLNG